MKLSQLLPIRFKVWLISHVPLLASYNRALIKRRINTTESSLIRELVAKTETMLAQQEYSQQKTVIHVLWLIDSKNSNPPTKNKLEHKNIKHWFISPNNSPKITIEKVFSQIRVSEYFCFILNNDDAFLENALHFIIKKITENQLPELVYWDNIVKNSAQKLVGHNFKPSWSPDYLVCFNYINRAAAIKKSIIDENFIKIAHKNILAAIYYLFLKNTAPQAQHKVLHIDEALQVLTDYQNVEIDKVRKEQEFQITKKILLDKAEINIKKNGIRSIKYNPPSRIITSTIIIPTRNGYGILKKCIDSIINSELQKNDNILVINNQSDCKKTIKYLNYLTVHKIATVLDYPHPFNYSSINNYAVKHCDTEVIVLLNNDIEVISKNWIVELKINAVRPGIGCVGAKLYYPDGTIQHGGVIIGIGGVADHAFKHEKGNSTGYQQRLITDQNYSAVTAACLAIKRETYIKVKGLNEKKLSVAFNDIDLCLKVKEEGLRNLWLSNVELIHHESKTRGYDTRPEKAARFLQEITYMKRVWKTDNKKDPCYNKNLSKKNHFFSINYD